MRLKEAAVWYAEHELPVFPCHWPTGTGCSCGEPDCPTPGKHPRTEHGFKDASTDRAQISAWWDKWPRANIGLATGKVSGLLVMDCDPRNGGPAERGDLVRQFGPVPETAEQLTGGGGRHFFFRYSGGSSVPQNLGKGIDLKADGGYVILAPSLHQSGKRYEWDGIEGAKALLHPAEVPPWLQERIDGARNGGAPAKPADTTKWAEGTRNNQLISLAGTMRRRGMTQDAIAAALLVENGVRCDPPLSEAEVRGIAKSAARYEPAQAATHETKQPPGNVVERQPGYPLTEMGNAERFVSQHGANVRYCHDWRAWLAWDGVRWRRDAGAEVRQFAKDTVRTIYGEAGKYVTEAQRAAAANWAKRSESAAAIEAMLKLAQSEKGIPISPDDLDSDRWLLNLRNGTVNLRTGELRPHRRDDLISKLAPVCFDPAATCPRWERFLAEVFAPHPDVIPFSQRAVGYSLTGQTREECLFLLHGVGRNGKGTFLKTLTLSLGDYAGTADFSAFVQRRDDAGPRDDIANMKGRRLVSAQESREGAALAESLIKWLTGGDLVRARRLYENSTEFDPTWKIWLASNHRPIIRGCDPAIWSRIKLIPFAVVFDGREDKRLKAVLQDELPGILNWAIEGCLRWQEEGLEFPASVLTATSEYRSESDQIGRFVAESCIAGESASAKARGLYGAYKKWATETGEEPATETGFGRRLGERGFMKRHTDKGAIYDGIGLRTDSD